MWSETVGLRTRPTRDQKKLILVLQAVVLVLQVWCCFVKHDLVTFVVIMILKGTATFQVTGHYLRWRMPPFMRQCWGLPHRLAQCTRPQGWGKLVNAALLSIINEACVNVCCATLLLGQLVGPACAHARSSNPRGRACRPSGKGSGLTRVSRSLYT